MSRLGSQGNHNEGVYPARILLTQTDVKKILDGCKRGHLPAFVQLRRNWQDICWHHKPELTKLMEDLSGSSKDLENKINNKEITKLNADPASCAKMLIHAILSCNFGKPREGDRMFKILSEIEYALAKDCLDTKKNRINRNTAEYQSGLYKAIDTLCFSKYPYVNQCLDRLTSNTKTMREQKDRWLEAFFPEQQVITWENNKEANSDQRVVERRRMNRARPGTKLSPEDVEKIFKGCEQGDLKAFVQLRIHQTLIKESYIRRFNRMMASFEHNHSVSMEKIYEKPRNEASCAQLFIYAMLLYKGDRPSNQIYTRAESILEELTGVGYPPARDCLQRRKEYYQSNKSEGDGEEVGDVISNLFLIRGPARLSFCQSVKRKY